MLSAVIPPSSGFSQATRPLSMSTAVSALSVATRRTPEGVTCCHRILAFSLTLHAVCALPGAAVWPWAVLTMMQNEISTTIRRSTCVDDDGMELSCYLSEG